MRANESTEQSLLTSTPFYVSTDGILLVVRSGDNEIREMTAEERILFKCDDFEREIFKTSDKAQRRVAEVGVKIKVI